MALGNLEGATERAEARSEGEGLVGRAGVGVDGGGQGRDVARDCGDWRFSVSRKETLRVLPKRGSGREDGRR